MSETYKRILVAVDGSYESELAVEKAIHAALRNKAELILAHVIDEQSYSFQGEGVLDDYGVNEHNDHANGVLDDYIKLAKDKGVTNVKKVLEVGSPKVLLSKTIPEKEDVDLIMVGATGLNAFERLFVGSTSEYIMRHTKVDLLIVRNNQKTL